MKGPVRLAVYRKRLAAPAAGTKKLPVLFLVHGSSLSALSSFDIDAPGIGDYSLMNYFARAGFDVWTMDHEGYGRSTVTQGNSDIASGVADLAAAAPLVERETGEKAFHFYGESSGGLRAGAFANAHPERVKTLALAAFTYTGKGSPTLGDRAKQLEFYRSHNRRTRDLAMVKSIFTRDKPGTADPRLADAIWAKEKQFGDTVPTGTYLDMTANLPVVDPAKIEAPVLLIRGEYDGIATEEDILDFLAKLASHSKQYAVIPGAAHGVLSGYNRHLGLHVVESFLTMPPEVPLKTS
ncbi:MAG TPA: alpha/beta fold hydrolase [Stellaceae bacterium]|jgi:pimeloyl-ACP methyl ester carboxylesterase